MTEEDVYKLAKLARLQLTPAEVAHLGPQIDRILEFAGQLSALDTEDVAPMATALDVNNRWRDDVRQPSLDRQDALSNAPRHDSSCFLVPAVLGPAGH